MPAQQNFDEDAWDDLLNYIEERRVIPIIGPDLLRVQTDRGPAAALRMAGREARRAAVGRYRRAAPAAHAQRRACAATSASAAAARKPTRACARSCARCSSSRRRRCASSRRSPTSTCSSPRPSTRCSSRRSTSSATAASPPPKSSPTRRTASPTCRSSAASCSAPVVYHLLGRLSASPTYVVSDEDMLEFICALQSEHLTPEKLFHELEHNHLLLIGSDFSNWLARLFLRMAKRRRLSDPRDVGEVFADDHTMQDERLVAFLQQVSVRTRVYGGAEAFVAELHARWTARQRPAGVHAGGRHARRSASCRRRARCRRTRSSSATRARTCPPCSGSRRRSTRPASPPGSTSTGSKAATTTTARSTPTSRAAASSCPVISATTQRRHEGYFRREWSYAVDRSRNIAEGAVFILPVCIDDTPEAEALVPEQVQGRCTSRACRAASRRPSSCAGCRNSSAGAAHEPDQPGRRRLGRPSIPRIRGSACPRTPRRRRAYFHGRDEEAAELARRVQRKLLTVLFGQSGLGKTSLLRAGLVPRLRGEGYCPVYVRIDYSPDSPPPSEQIKQAIFRATAGRGPLDAARLGGRGRVAVGVPAPPRRPAARCRAAARCCRC